MKKGLQTTIMGSVETEPKITVGVMERQTEVLGHLDADFRQGGAGPVSGRFSAKAEEGMIVLRDETRQEICRSKLITLTGEKGSTFSLFNVPVGKRFHWEHAEHQTFEGDLILRLGSNGLVTAINHITLEDYLKSVISSEMSGDSPTEFLKVHAIISRSWLLAAIHRKKRTSGESEPVKKTAGRQEEVMRWYDREDHELFDVCADDHCQRYQGITKIVSNQAKEAVRGTRGIIITHQNEICDARYSKACGGITENFDTAWNDISVPYLRSISDASILYSPITTEKEASAWILSNPEAYCRTKDKGLLEKILPDYDRETTGFFRWRMEYLRTELEEILRKKSGFDFGTLQEILPLRRGPSGRISRLRIVGSKRNMVVGKELEIRRWLSRSHLYSSAFIVKVEGERFIFHGAGWGHGVGLCQIGAAVMATQGFSAEEILKHYFSGVEVKKIY